MTPDEALDGLIGLFALAFFGVVYFTPGLLAAIRRHHNTLPIFALNLLFGWTIIGWFAAVIWSLTSPPKDRSNG